MSTSQCTEAAKVQSGHTQCLSNAMHAADTSVKGLQIGVVCCLLKEVWLQRANHRVLHPDQHILNALQEVNCTSRSQILGLRPALLIEYSDWQVGIIWLDAGISTTLEVPGSDALKEPSISYSSQT